MEIWGFFIDRLELLSNQGQIRDYATNKFVLAFSLRGEIIISFHQRSTEIGIADVAVLEAGRDVITGHEFQSGLEGHGHVGRIVGIGVVESDLLAVEQKRHFGALRSGSAGNAASVSVTVVVEEVSAADGNGEDASGRVHGRMRSDSSAVSDDDSIIAVGVFSSSFHVEVN